MLVSIVMPSYNQVKFLPIAIESVLNQSWQNLELIVRDGGSNDGSVDVLKAFSENDSRLRWTSVADSGPASAINSALADCRGDVIGWLNSDDKYSENAVRDAVGRFKSRPEVAMVYGDACHIDENGVYLYDYPTKPHRADDNYTIPNLAGFKASCFICQPSVFFRSTLYQLLGELDESLNASFDFDYWLRIFRYCEERIEYLPKLLSSSRLHSETITEKQRMTVAIEGMRVLFINGVKVEENWALSYISEISRSSESNAELELRVKKICNEAKKYIPNSAYVRLTRSIQSRFGYNL